MSKNVQESQNVQKFSRETECPKCSRETECPKMFKRERMSINVQES